VHIDGQWWTANNNDRQTTTDNNMDNQHWAPSSTTHKWWGVPSTTYRPAWVLPPSTSTYYEQQGGHTTTTDEWQWVPPPSTNTHPKQPWATTHEQLHHHQPLVRRANHHHQWMAMRACLFFPSCLPFNVHNNNIVYLFLFKYIWILHVHSYMMLQGSLKTTKPTNKLQKSVE